MGGGEGEHSKTAEFALFVGSICTGKHLPETFGKVERYAREAP
jgi:hypothetical protein